MVFKNGFFLIPLLSFFADLAVKISKVVLCKAAIFHKTSDFVVDILGESWFVPVLQLKFAYKHSFKLLTFLDINEPLPAGLTHLGPL
jgi:hypothetical protein